MSSDFSADSAARGTAYRRLGLSGEAGTVFESSARTKSLPDALAGPDTPAKEMFEVASTTSSAASGYRFSSEEPTDSAGRDSHERARPVGVTPLSAELLAASPVTAYTNSSPRSSDRPDKKQALLRYSYGDARQNPANTNESSAPWTTSPSRVSRAGAESSQVAPVSFNVLKAKFIGSPSNDFTLRTSREAGATHFTSATPPSRSVASSTPYRRLSAPVLTMQPASASSDLSPRRCLVPGDRPISPARVPLAGPAPSAGSVATSTLASPRRSYVQTPRGSVCSPRGSVDTEQQDTVQVRDTPLLSEPSQNDGVTSESRNGADASLLTARSNPHLSQLVDLLDKKHFTEEDVLLELEAIRKRSMLTSAPFNKHILPILAYYLLRDKFGDAAATKYVQYLKGQPATTEKNGEGLVPESFVPQVNAIRRDRRAQRELNRQSPTHHYRVDAPASGAVRESTNSSTARSPRRRVEPVYSMIDGSSLLPEAPPSAAKGVKRHFDRLNTNTEHRYLAERHREDCEDCSILDVSLLSGKEARAVNAYRVTQTMSSDSPYTNNPASIDTVERTDGHIDARPTGSVAQRAPGGQQEYSYGDPAVDETAGRTGASVDNEDLHRAPRRARDRAGSQGPPVTETTALTPTVSAIPHVSGQHSTGFYSALTDERSGQDTSSAAMRSLDLSLIPAVDAAEASASCIRSGTRSLSDSTHTRALQSDKARHRSASVPAPDSTATTGPGTAEWSYSFGPGPSVMDGSGASHNMSAVSGTTAPCRSPRSPSGATLPPSAHTSTVALEYSYGGDMSNADRSRSTSAATARDGTYGSLLGSHTGEKSHNPKSSRASTDKARHGSTTVGSEKCNDTCAFDSRTRGTPTHEYSAFSDNNTTTNRSGQSGAGYGSVMDASASSGANNTTTNRSGQSGAGYGSVMDASASSGANNTTTNRSGQSGAGYGSVMDASAFSGANNTTTNRSGQSGAGYGSVMDASAFSGTNNTTTNRSGQSGAGYGSVMDASAFSGANNTTTNRSGQSGAGYGSVMDASAFSGANNTTTNRSGQSGAGEHSAGGGEDDRLSRSEITSNGGYSGLYDAQKSGVASQSVHSANTQSDIVGCPGSGLPINHSGCCAAEETVMSLRGKQQTTTALLHAAGYSLNRSGLPEQTRSLNSTGTYGSGLIFHDITTGSSVDVSARRGADPLLVAQEATESSSTNRSSNNKSSTSAVSTAKSSTLDVSAFQHAMKDLLGASYVAPRSSGASSSSSRAISAEDSNTTQPSQDQGGSRTGSAEQSDSPSALLGSAHMLEAAKEISTEVHTAHKSERLTPLEASAMNPSVAADPNSTAASYRYSLTAFSSQSEEDDEGNRAAVTDGNASVVVGDAGQTFTAASPQPPLSSATSRFGSERAYYFLGTSSLLGDSAVAKSMVEPPSEGHPTVSAAASRLNSAVAPSDGETSGGYSFAYDTSAPHKTVLSGANGDSASSVAPDADLSALCPMAPGSPPPRSAALGFRTQAKSGAPGGGGALARGAPRDRSALGDNRLSNTDGSLSRVHVTIISNPDDRSTDPTPHNIPMQTSTDSLLTAVISDALLPSQPRDDENDDDNTGQVGFEAGSDPSHRVGSKFPTSAASARRPSAPRTTSESSAVNLPKVSHKSSQQGGLRTGSRSLNVPSILQNCSPNQSTSARAGLSVATVRVDGAGADKENNSFIGVSTAVGKCTTVTPGASSALPKVEPAQPERSEMISYNLSLFDTSTDKTANTATGAQKEDGEEGEKRMTVTGTDVGMMTAMERSALPYDATRYDVSRNNNNMNAGNAIQLPPDFTRLVLGDRGADPSYYAPAETTTAQADASVRLPVNFTQMVLGDRGADPSYNEDGYLIAGPHLTDTTQDASTMSSKNANMGREHVLAKHADLATVLAASRLDESSAMTPLPAKEAAPRRSAAGTLQVNGVTIVDSILDDTRHDDDDDDESDEDFEEETLDESGSVVFHNRTGAADIGTLPDASARAGEPSVFQHGVLNDESDVVVATTGRRPVIQANERAERDAAAVPGVCLKKNQRNARQRRKGTLLDVSNVPWVDTPDISTDGDRRANMQKEAAHDRKVMQWAMRGLAMQRQEREAQLYEERMRWQQRQHQARQPVPSGVPVRGRPVYGAQPPMMRQAPPPGPPVGPQRRFF